MLLQIDPFFFNAQQAVNEIAKPFLDKHKLNYFQFGRVYEDGANSFLVTNTDFIKARVKHRRGPKSHTDTEQLDKQSYFFLWNNNLPDIDTDLARELNMDNGLCFIERFEYYFNVIAFAAPIKEKSIVNFYLNHLSLLKQFIGEFKDKAHQLIHLADEKRIALPDDLRDENTQTLLWPKNRKLQFSHGGISVALSMREWECLKKLAYGSTIKMTALDLGLSPRTVESYLNRVKCKVGLHSKSELLSLFHRYFTGMY